jgi:hypothetical protein
MRSILKGATDQSVVIRIVDSTDGTPETGVTSATGGLDLKYRREGAATVDLTESDLAALDSAHSDGGMKHIGAGYYRIDLPDAAVATGANGVLVFGTVTGMVVIACYVHLLDYNPQDAVRLGLTALPNAAAEAAGGLFTRGSGAGQINQNANGQIDVRAVAAIAGFFDAVWSVAARTLTDFSAAFKTGYSIGTGGISAASFAAGAIDAAATSADFVTEVQSGLATSANQTTLLNRIGAFTGTGVNTILGFFKALLSKDASTPSDVGGTFSAATDSVETLREKADDIESDTQNLQSRTPAALVGGRMDSSVGAMANDVITAAALSQAAAQEVADEVLDRNLAGGGSGDTRNVRNALRALRNRVADDGAGLATIYEEDDVTPSWTAVTTRNAALDPLQEVNPS